jgi:hypothetical protein
MNLSPNGGYRYAKRVRILLQSSKLAKASESTIFSPPPKFFILNSFSTSVNFNYKGCQQQPQA